MPLVLGVIAQPMRLRGVETSNREELIMPDTVHKVVTIARGVEVSGDPAMANALRRWLVATRGDGGEVAREIFKQQRAARRERRVNQ